MAYISFALFLFILSVIVHLFYCRNSIKSRLHTKSFILTSFFALGIYVLIVQSSPLTDKLDPHSLWGLPFKITAEVIFILMIPVYLIFYVLTQLNSPSKTILLRVSQRGQMSYADIVKCIQQEDFINTRLKDLNVSGCIKQADGHIELSLSGQRIAKALNIMQNILGRNIGG